METIDEPLLLPKPPVLYVFVAPADDPALECEGAATTRRGAAFGTALKTPVSNETFAAVGAVRGAPEASKEVGAVSSALWNAAPTGAAAGATAGDAASGPAAF